MITCVMDGCIIYDVHFFGFYYLLVINLKYYIGNPIVLQIRTADEFTWTSNLFSLLHFVGLWGSFTTSDVHRSGAKASNNP